MEKIKISYGNYYSKLYKIRNKVIVNPSQDDLYHQGLLFQKY